MNYDSRSPLSPEAETRLRSTDPFATIRDESMTMSRKHTSEIPQSGFSPTITQHGPIRSNGGTYQNRWGKFALAAGTVLVLGAVAFGLSNSSLNSAGPAAPTVLGQGFNPTDPASFTRFAESGGVQLTGRIRPVVDGDPENIRSTGWVMDVYVIGGNPQNTDKLPSFMSGDETFVPIDMTGFDTRIISEQFDSHPLGLLAVVMDTRSNDSVIVPAPGNFGVVYSDRLLLAASDMDSENSQTLKTLDGTPVDVPDVRMSNADLAQFADFTMLHEFTKNPIQDPTTVKVTRFDSHLDSTARACIVASDASGQQILSFPQGSTASISSPDTGAKVMASSAPQRISSPYKSGAPIDLASFLLDTREMPKASIKVWPTGKQGNCGDTTGEIVDFAGVNK